MMNDRIPAYYFDGSCCSSDGKPRVKLHIIKWHAHDTRGGSYDMHYLKHYHQLKTTVGGFIDGLLMTCSSLQFVGGC